MRTVRWNNDVTMFAFQVPPLEDLFGLNQLVLDVKVALGNRYSVKAGVGKLAGRLRITRHGGRVMGRGSYLSVPPECWLVAAPAPDRAEHTEVFGYTDAEFQFRFADFDPAAGDESQRVVEDVARLLGVRLLGR